MFFGYKLIIIAILTTIALSKRERNEVTDFAAYRADVGQVGSMVSAVSEAYVSKIIAYSADPTLNFLPMTDGATITLTDEDVVNSLKADGTNSSYSACSESGSIVGTSPQGFLSCEIPSKIPVGFNTEMTATFTRTFSSSVPVGYTTGFSQINGVITFGGYVGEEFSINGEVDNAWLARDIRDHIIGNSNGLSNNLEKGFITYDVGANGELQATISMVRTDEPVYFRDGSLPLTGNLNAGINDINDVKGLYWGTVTSGTIVSTLTSDGDISLAEGKGVYFDSSNLINNNVKVVSGKLEITAETASFSKDVEVAETLSAKSITIKDSGASLANATQLSGFIDVGDTVPYPDCITSGNEAIELTVGSMYPTSDALAITGWGKPIATRQDASSTWATSLDIYYEDTSVSVAPSGTTLKVRTFCNE